MPFERYKAAWPHLPRPWLNSVAILTVIFTTEYALMFALSWLLPEDSPRFLEAALDAVLLTMVVSPMLWWTLVRPLQHAARLRDHFLADLFSTIEDERRRIARELHDGVGQTLTMLVCGLRSLIPLLEPSELERRESELQGLAQRALTDIKQLARGLRPSLLDDLGLAAAVERIAGEVAENHQLSVDVDVEALAGVRLPERVETAIFRIFQEAIANVVQHSNATAVSIHLGRESRHVVLVVSDNGHGINASAAQQSVVSGHLGLVGMHERAGLLGGQLTICSSPGSGMTITAAIPA